MKSYPIGTLTRFIRILSKSFSSLERIVMALLLVLALASSAQLVINARTVLVPAPGGMLTEGMVGSAKTIHPLFARSETDITMTKLVFSGLLSMNERQEVVPALAEKYDISSDRLTYTVTLRENARWHDGEKLTADDVIFTTAVIKNPDYNLGIKAQWEGVKIEKVDEKTVRFVLPRVYPQFLQALTVGLVPRHIWNDIPVSDMAASPANLKPIGAGPYKIAKIKQGIEGKMESLSLDAFSGYALGSPHISNIDFVFYETRADMIEAFENRAFTSFGIFSFEDAVAGDNTRGFRNITAYVPNYSALFFNAKKGGVATDRSIRQAISLSLDKNSVNRAVNFGAGRVIHGPILPGFLGYDDQMVAADRDVRSALSLLTQAGWNDADGDGIREKDGKKMTLAVSVPDEGQFVRLAEAFKVQMRDIGLEVNVQTVDPARFQDEVVSGRNYESLLIGESLGTDSDPYSYWHSSQVAAPGLNLAQVENVEIDKLLEEARQSTDANVKIRNYKQFQKMIAEDLPAIFFYQPVYVYKVFNRVQGVDLSNVTQVSDRFNGIRNWYINTERVPRNR